uniref:Uncharacterized protein n=1 Tax=Timema bartmani TaxID=61472 RepID=A0A7R9F2G0_9NEOP|nr:unnamed protein product [Timema bartmani]
MSGSWFSRTFLIIFLSNLCLVKLSTDVPTMDKDSPYQLDDKQVEDSVRIALNFSEEHNQDYEDSLKLTKTLYSAAFYLPDQALAVQAVLRRYKDVIATVGPKEFAEEVGKSDIAWYFLLTKLDLCFDGEKLRNAGESKKLSDVHDYLERKIWELDFFLVIRNVSNDEIGDSKCTDVQDVLQDLAKSNLVKDDIKSDLQELKRYVRAFPGDRQTILKLYKPLQAGLDVVFRNDYALDAFDPNKIVALGLNGAMRTVRSLLTTQSFKLMYYLMNMETENFNTQGEYIRSILEGLSEKTQIPENLKDNMKSILTVFDEYSAEAKQPLRKAKSSRRTSEEKRETNALRCSNILEAKN